MWAHKGLEKLKVSRIVTTIFRDTDQELPNSIVFGN
jgi:hypothetical protein